MWRPAVPWRSACSVHGRKQGARRLDRRHDGGDGACAEVETAAVLTPLTGLWRRFEPYRSLACETAHTRRESRSRHSARLHGPRRTSSSPACRSSVLVASAYARAPGRRGSGSLERRGPGSDVEKGGDEGDVSAAFVARDVHTCGCLDEPPARAVGCARAASHSTPPDTSSPSQR